MIAEYLRSTDTKHERSSESGKSDGKHYSLMTATEKFALFEQEDQNLQKGKNHFMYSNS